MTGARLTPLQRRLIVLLADLEPPWTLTGGAALAGFHTGHRGTRDLDLRWPGSRELAGVPVAVLERLRAAGLACQVLQSGPSFERLHVGDGSEVVLVDLVADPVPSIEPPSVEELDGIRLQVDSAYEILVNKLCALLGRMELRDLEDLRALLDAGGDLEGALADAPRKDGGFSVLTLSWVIQGMPADRLAQATGWSRAEAESIERFKLALIDRLTDAAASEIETRSE